MRTTSAAPFLASFKLALAGGALSGLLYWAAFPGVDLWPLTFVAFVPLYIATIGQSPRRALAAGTMMGLVINLTGFSWLLGMLKTFSGFSWPLCALFMLIISTAQGLRYGFQAWLFARGQMRGWPRVPLFLVCFVASEQLFPLLFDFYYGATVHKAPLLMQTAELGGPILVGTFLLLINLLIAAPLVARLEARPVDRRLLIAGTTATLFMLIFGAIRIRSTDRKAAASEPVLVGLVQANMGLKDKRTNSFEGLRRHLALTEELKAAGADLVVWSETSVMRPISTRFYRDEVARTIGQKIGLPSIIGAVLVDRDVGKRSKLYNTALSLDAAGDVTGRYDKTYLLKFGEALPFGEQFPILYKWSPNSGSFSAGRSLEPLVVTVNGALRRISTMICYEDILPGFADKMVRAGHPDLLVNMTNDAWFGDTSEPWEHLALAQFRSIEHRRYLVRSTNSGVSAFVDPVGRVMDRTGVFTQEAKLASLRWMHGETVYEFVQDWPWYLASVAAVLAAFVSRRRFARTAGANAAA